MNIFTYGSLMNEASRTRTLRSKVRIEPAVVTGGWKRRLRFNVPADDGRDVYLGLEVAPRGERIQGGVFQVHTLPQLNALVRRERYYDLVRIPAAHLLPRFDAPVYTFVPKRRHLRRGVPSERYVRLVEGGREEVWGGSIEQPVHPHT
jgi:cation transport regulator ChaC